MVKKKLPDIVQQIRNFKPQEINYAFQKNISYSQMSMYWSCPKKWALQYRDGHKVFTSTIHTVFGSSIHETVQNYLHVLYEENGAAADEIDLEEYFEDRFRENYIKQYNDNKKTHFSSSEEMREFFEDGIAILEFIKKKRNEYFTKRGYYLVGVEIPIVLSPDKRYSNVLFNGFIDLIIYHEPTNTFTIYDIKTSGRGWGDKEKKDEYKQFQVLFYKSFFSEQFGIPEDNIEVQFFILKRKLWETSDFVQKRIQEFIPAQGKIKMKKAKNALSTFIENVFNLDGTYKSTEHLPNPSKSNCKYCPYSSNKNLCPSSVS
jgi:hypothetical protein